jgi:hypothetical protein
MKTQDIKNMASAYMQVLEKAKMDKVNPKALEKDFDDREDKDIDNDGDTDKSDEYLHNRRKAVKNAMKKEAKDYGPGHIGAVQKMLDKEREAKKAKDAMKKEEVEELDEISRDTARSYISKASAHKTTGETPKKDRSSGVELAGKKAYGIGGKAKVMATEEVEELDELSKKTLGSYIKKATGDAMTKSFKAGDVRDKDSTDNRLKAMGRQMGIAKATNKLTKEEADLDEAAPKMKPDFIKTQREKDRAHDDAMGRTPTGRKKTMTSTQRSMASMRKEEVDIDEGLMDKIKSGAKKARLAVYGKTEKEKRADASATLHKGASAFVKASHFAAHHRHVDAALDGPKKPGSDGHYAHLGHQAAASFHSMSADEARRGKLPVAAGEHHQKASEHHHDAHDHLVKYSDTGHVKHLKKAAYHSKQAVIHAKNAKKAGGDHSYSHETDRDTQGALHTYKKMNEEFANMSMREKLQLQKESILEREMTDAEKKKREDIVMGMKKNKADLEKRYGTRWKDVMYATATKQAMESVDDALAMTKNLLTTKESFNTETTTWPVYVRIKEANDRAMHYKSATPPETMNDKMTASDKAFIAPHGSLNGVDSGIDGAKAAEYTAKHATDGIKPGAGMNRPNDQKTGDKKIMDNFVRKIREAYAEMLEKQNSEISEISQQAKKNYLKKAIGSDDDYESPSMANLKVARKIPQKHRDSHSSPITAPNKNLDKYIANRKKGIERATGSAEKAKSITKSVDRFAKNIDRGHDDTNINKGMTHLSKARKKAGLDK